MRPAKHAAKQRCVETFRWRQASLDLSNGHFVLWRRAE